ncbi:MAG: hypothetical protein V4719_10770 [Planctomycetota bacterium]
MNPARTKQHIRIDEGTSPKLLSRCLDGNENPILSTAIGSISYTVFNVTSGFGQPVVKAGPTNLSVSDVWHNTLQLTGWQSDRIGYNFSGHIPASCFSSTELPAQQYQVEIRATPFSGDPFWVGIWIVDVDATLSFAS